MRKVIATLLAAPLLLASTTRAQSGSGRPTIETASKAPQDEARKSTVAELPLPSYDRHLVNRVVDAHGSAPQIVEARQQSPGEMGFIVKASGSNDDSESDLAVAGQITGLGVTGGGLLLLEGANSSHGERGSAGVALVGLAFVGVGVLISCLSGNCPD